jgi:hypothetical protein
MYQETSDQICAGVSVNEPLSSASYRSSMQDPFLRVEDCFCFLPRSGIDMDA